MKLYVSTTVPHFPVLHFSVPHFWNFIVILALLVALLLLIIKSDPNSIVYVTFVEKLYSNDDILML